MEAQSSPFLPPELRAHIATLCSRRSLVRLALMDRLWAATCEPAIYMRIYIPIREEGAELERVSRCLTTLSTSRMKALYVRECLIEYDLAIFFMYSNVGPVKAVSQRLFQVLQRTANLADLRIQITGSWTLPAELCKGFLGRINRDVFRLHTLYISAQLQRHAVATQEALVAQRETLRVIGVELANTPHNFAPPHDDCVMFGFRQFGDKLRLVLTRPDELTVHTVAQSVFAWRPMRVVELSLHLDSLSSRHVTDQLAARFPDIAELRLFLAVIPEMETLVNTVRAFTHLRFLRIHSIVHERDHFSPDAHLETVCSLADAGLNSLRAVEFPDGRHLNLIREAWKSFAPPDNDTESDTPMRLLIRDFGWAPWLSAHGARASVPA